MLAALIGRERSLCLSEYLCCPVHCLQSENFTPLLQTTMTATFTEVFFIPLARPQVLLRLLAVPYTLLTKKTTSLVLCSRTRSVAINTLASRADYTPSIYYKSFKTYWIQHGAEVTVHYLVLLYRRPVNGRYEHLASWK